MKQMKFHVIALAMLCGAAMTAAAAEKTPAAQPKTEEAMAPMRDGVKLATTVYIPDGEGPWPVVLIRTPYNKDGAKGMTKDLLKNGFVIAAQDCRGRFKSEGEYIPFKTDREDGYDAVEWAAKQPWSTGKIGMWGGSALGITTNLAAAAHPPHLVCGYVIVAPSSWRNQTLRMGGLWRKEMIDGWMEGQKSTPARIDWQKKAIADPYFDWLEIFPDYDKITIPMYNVGGWFDIFCQGNVDNFVGLQAKGAGNAKGNQKLLMGPIAHGALTSRFKYPKNSGDVRGGDMIRWFSHWLKGEENGIMKEPAVYYYLMGDAEAKDAPGNVWRTADSWPPKSEDVSYYLHADGSLSVNMPKKKDSHTEYTYDPKDPVKTIGGANLVFALKGPDDQRKVGERKDYFKFQTEPLAQPVEVVGRLAAELFVSTDAPDTDFMVKLVDVYPDGYEALLQDSGLRLRYRDGIDKEVMMKAEEITKIKIDLWSTANVFNAGHRIAVHVTSSNDPRYDPNPNTGKPLRADDETRVAHNVFYHDASHASRVILPVTAKPAATAQAGQ